MQLVTHRSHPAPVPATCLLIVEHQANRRDGHFMKELEAIATAAARDGHAVHVLADDRLAIEEENRTLPGVAGVHRVAPRWIRAARRGRRLSTFGRGRRWQVIGVPIRYVGYVLFQRGLVRGVAERSAEVGGVPALVLSRDLRVDWAIAFAPLSAQWVVYELTAGGPPARWGLPRLFAWRERRREAAGGWIRLVANNPAVEAHWKERISYVESLVCPLAGASDRTPLDRSEARAQLGFALDDQIALAFGVSHPGKDLETTLLAFAGEHPRGQLVLAGAGVERLFQQTKARHAPLDFGAVTVLDGPQSDETKRLLHSAADYVVLSYRRHRTNDSGTLADAIGFSLPVCCSDDSAVAELVRSYRLGRVFAAGNPDALRACTDQMSTFALREEDRLRFLNDWSVEGISRRLVAASVLQYLDS